MNTTTIPRPEYPRPQLRRESFINLNGEWEFEIDNEHVGEKNGYFDPAHALSGKITVPFCPESKLSGVGNVDFMTGVWYRRKVTLEKKCGKRYFLHFGAADYLTRAAVNGKPVGMHFGGYSSFSFDITDAAENGENVITVCCYDDVRCRMQPAGKQSVEFLSRGCSYTRTTGIWQTVWIEEVPETYIKALRLTPNVSAGQIVIEAECVKALGKTLAVEAGFDGKCEGKAEVTVRDLCVTVALPLDTVHLWEIGVGGLYDLKLTLGEDKVESYFGMRSAVYEDNRLIFNGRPLYQRLILDQGFYPDGIYTAPTDSELEADVLRSMAMGFNGARLHQKVFEPRFLYYCDLHGYIVWGEHASWVTDISSGGYPSEFENQYNDGSWYDHKASAAVYRAFISEWTEIIKRDYSHPAIIGWCPFNETEKTQDRDLLRLVYDITKAYDRTRPVIDTSGYIHVITDVVDFHDYDPSGDSLAAKYGENGSCGPEMSFLSEYGGIWWAPQLLGTGTDNWGYGNNPRTPEEWLERFKKQTDALLDSPRLSAFCYTQLTDIEQEVNGLYYYDRRPKFDPELIRQIVSRKAKIEE